jgi:alpha-1,2-mannosyltransferase/arabinofuranan 3-O-arabinosyltransferase
MAGLVAAWIAARRGRPVVEGAILGLVVALKPSLAPLLLIAVVRRRRSTVLSGLLATAVATAVGAGVAGWSSLVDWIDLLAGHSRETYFDNAALPGAFLRLLGDSGWGRPITHLAGGMQVGLAAGAILLAVTIRVVRRPPVGPDTAIWAVAAAALLASPLSWHNYLLILMPGLVVLLATGRWPVVALLVGLALIGMEWPGIWYGADGTASAVPLSLYSAILLGYWAALVPWRGAAAGDEMPDAPDAATTRSRP